MLSGILLWHTFLCRMDAHIFLVYLDGRRGNRCRDAFLFDGWGQLLLLRRLSRWVTFLQRRPHYFMAKYFFLQIYLPCFFTVCVLLFDWAHCRKRIFLEMPHLDQSLSGLYLLRFQLKSSLDFGSWLTKPDNRLDTVKLLFAGQIRL